MTDKQLIIICLVMAGIQASGWILFSRYGGKEAETGIGGLKEQVRVLRQDIQARDIQIANLVDSIRGKELKLIEIDSLISEQKTSARHRLDAIRAYDIDALVRFFSGVGSYSAP